MLLLKFGSIDYEYELVWQSVFLQFKGRFLQRKCARRVWLFYMCGGLNGCIRFWVWRVRGSNLHFTAPNDGTVSQWTPPRAAGEAILNGLAIPWWISLCWCWWLSLLEAIIFCSVLQSLEVLFFRELAVAISSVHSYLTLDHWRYTFFGFSPSVLN